MPTYRGNIGNLLQHWVLCELVHRCNQHWHHLRLVDAYSMAPCATDRPKQHWSSQLFDYARDRATPESLYERTWSALMASTSGYPNSAAFVTALWSGDYSLLLCEWDGTTVEALQEWARRQEAVASCAGVEIAPGDWRGRFERDVSDSEDLTVLSFDPDMFNRHGSNDGRKMTPSDLELVASIVKAIPGAVVVQLSTYDVNDDNGQADVEPAIISGLRGGGLELFALVRTDRQMMSLVFGRSCTRECVDEVAKLPGLFESWLLRLKASASVSAQPNHRRHPTTAGQQLSRLPPLPPSRRG